MTRYSLITDEKHIRAAQRQLKDRLSREAGPARVHKIGFPGGDVDEKVRYIPRVNLWYAIAEGHNRWWNAFGLGDPALSRAALPITVEINPSFAGSRQCAGLFLQDNRGRLHLGHTGRVGGGRTGIGKINFLATVRRERLVSVDDHEDILIGRIEDKNFSSELADFVRCVQAFKERVTASAKLPNAATQDERIPPEDRLRKYPAGESDEHKQLKLRVADHPELLAVGDVNRAHVEYSYVTGDRVDIMLELANGTHAVVEVERRGEQPTMIGAHQAIKYRALMAAERGVQVRQVVAVLVAHEIPVKRANSASNTGLWRGSSGPSSADSRAHAASDEPSFQPAANQC